MKPYIPLFCLLTSIFVACHNDTYDFKFSPTEPRAGQSITFTNLSTDGKEWSWEFGDIATSTVKSPSHIYKKPGTYIVVLTVDGKKNKRCSKEVTVYDTIPSIAASIDSMCIFQEINLSAIVYNPYSLSATYNWHLPEQTIIRSGNTDEASLTVLFTEVGQAAVSLSLTLGTENTQIDTVFNIHDADSPILYMLQDDHQLMQQRIFELGKQAPTPITLDGFKPTSPSTLLTQGDNLFILNSDNTAEGAIQTIRLSDYSIGVFVSNQTTDAALGYYGGCIKGDYLYWLSAIDAIHRLPLNEQNASFSTATDFLFADASTLTGLVGINGGITYCAGLWFLGTANGIFRFAETDIASGVAPQTAPILTDYKIREVAADPITKKIYFDADGSLYVCNYDGQNCTRLAETTGKLFVNNTDNYLYYTTTDGVVRIPLMQARENTTVFTPDTLNHASNIIAFTIKNLEN